MCECARESSQLRILVPGCNLETLSAARSQGNHHNQAATQATNTRMAIRRRTSRNTCGCCRCRCRRHCCCCCCCYCLLVGAELQLQKAPSHQGIYLTQTKQNQDSVHTQVYKCIKALYRVFEKQMIRSVSWWLEFRSLSVFPLTLSSVVLAPHRPLHVARVHRDFRTTLLLTHTENPREEDMS